MEDQAKESENEKELVSSVWKFRTLIQDPITKKWGNGVCLHNIALEPIAQIKTVYVKEDSSPIKVTKVVFESGDYIYIEDKPLKIAASLGWDLFVVNM